MNLPFLGLRNDWEKIIYFSKMNLKLKFKGTNLGFIWTFLEPLLLFSILYIVFSSIRESDEEYFAIYLITGVMLHNLFSRGSLVGLTCLRDNMPLLLTFKIKREFFPISATGTTTIMLLIELVVFFSLMPIFNFTPSWTMIYFPILLCLFLLLILGLSYLLSITFIFFKDIQFFLGNTYFCVIVCFTSILVCGLSASYFIKRTTNKSIRTVNRNRSHVSFWPST